MPILPGGCEDGLATDAENQEATALDGALVDLLDLGLLAKHASWNVVGPASGSLRVLLDELADLAGGSADSVAERAVALGHPADGRAATITKVTSLPALAGGALRDDKAIPAFVDILAAVVSRITSALDAFERDPVSMDLFTRVLASVEKFAWMLRALA